MAVSNFFGNLKNRIKAGALQKPMIALAGRIAEEARDTAPTQRIRDNIQVSSALIEAGNIHISIFVTMDKTEGAPEAAAYEYGSGLQRTQGPPEKPRSLAWL